MRAGVAAVLLLFGIGASAQDVAAPAQAIALPAKPEQVVVGVFLRNVESIDVENNTYYLSFTLWMKWKGPRDPTKTFRFVNLIDSWALTQTPVFDEPQKLADGSSYQRLHVEGRFFHKFWLGTFPLDWQKITLELEDPQRTVQDLVFVPDTAHSRMMEGLQIPGWYVTGTFEEEKRIPYPGGFGLTSTGAPVFSRYRFGARLQRPASLFFFKMAPPIALVLLCCYLVFFLRPMHVDARVGTVITALLTEVFLQLAFTDDLPYLGISVLLDQVFNFSYFTITLILVECVAVIWMMDRTAQLEVEIKTVADGESKKRIYDEIQALKRRTVKLDRISKAAFPVLYLVGATVIVLVARGTELFSLPF